MAAYASHIFPLEFLQKSCWKFFKMSFQDSSKKCSGIFQEILMGSFHKTFGDFWGNASVILLGLFWNYVEIVRNILRRFFRTTLWKLAGNLCRILLKILLKFFRLLFDDSSENHPAILLELIHGFFWKPFPLWLFRILPEILAEISLRYFHKSRYDSGIQQDRRFFRESLRDSSVNISGILLEKLWVFFQKPFWDFSRYHSRIRLLRLIQKLFWNYLASIRFFWNAIPVEFFR